MKTNTHPSIQNMWDAYRVAYPKSPIQHPELIHFCDNQKDANECAELVIQGIKQATTTSLWWFEHHKVSIPQKGVKYLVTNWESQAKAIIEVTKVQQIPYKEITKEYAAIEGEGDLSLEYWKKVHWDYYAREMATVGKKPTSEMILICEYFRTIWN